MIQQQATVLWNQPVGPGCYRMGLACTGGYEAAVPGQFVMLQVEPGLAPLLRRPFSIFALIGDRKRPKGIELLYKAVGKGTLKMTRLEPGQRVDLLGPLGRGFRVNVGGSSQIYLVAGGLGVAPIHFLATHLKQSGVDTTGCRLFLGGRSRDDLLCRDELVAMGIPVTVTTDDGSSGEQCLITDPLEEAVRLKAPDMIFGCGPHGMLLCLAGMAKRYHVACQLSMETMMACGMGACLGCAVPMAESGQGYRHVCVDGPVFDAGEVQW